MKKLVLIFCVMLGVYWAHSWVWSPKKQIEELIPKAEINTPVEQQKNLQNMAQYLTETSGKIIPATEAALQTGQPGRRQTPMEKVQFLLQKMTLISNKGDPAEMKEAVKMVAALFTEFGSENVQERLGLISGVLQQPAIASQPEFKEFLLSVVDGYYQSTDMDLKTVSNHAASAYFTLESDSEVREKFKERYLTADRFERNDAESAPPADLPPLEPPAQDPPPPAEE